MTVSLLHYAVSYMEEATNLLNSQEWVKLEHKGKYSGEVFIEMTFYSSVCFLSTFHKPIMLTRKV